MERQKWRPQLSYLVTMSPILIMTTIHWFIYSEDSDCTLRSHSLMKTLFYLQGNAQMPIFRNLTILTENEKIGHKIWKLLQELSPGSESLSRQIRQQGSKPASTSSSSSLISPELPGDSSSSSWLRSKGSESLGFCITGGGWSCTSPFIDGYCSIKKVLRIENPNPTRYRRTYHGDHKIQLLDGGVKDWKQKGSIGSISNKVPEIQRVLGESVLKNVDDDNLGLMKCYPQW